MSSSVAVPVVEDEKKENKFVSFLEAVGRDFEKAFSFIIPYANAATPIVGLVGLATGNPELGAAYNAVDQTLQNIVIQTEQKFAAMKKQNGTGASKLAEVVAVATPAVTQILSSVKVPVDTATITKWTNAVVGLLNAYPAPVK